MTEAAENTGDQARLMSGVDFGRAASDYATHRAGLPHRFFDLLEAHGVRIAGSHAVDLGTGTGSGRAQPRAARRDGHGRGPVGGDGGAGAEAGRGRGCNGPLRTGDGGGDGAASGARRTRDRGAGVVVVRPAPRHRGGKAAADGGRTPRNLLARLATPPGSIPEATEALILAANPKWTLAGGMGRHPNWLDELRAAGFGDCAVFEFDETVPYSHEAWRGRIRASAGVAATLSEDEVARFE